MELRLFKVAVYKNISLQPSLQTAPELSPQPAPQPSLQLTNESKIKPAKQQQQNNKKKK
tara:strand:- start:375 stop:551 length:177 start_codon:yes stop_codon:yes gene_type:complete